MEIFFTLLYAFLIGFYNTFKKLAVRKGSNESAILAIFTTVCFLCALIWIPYGIRISSEFVLLLAFKGFILSISWFLTLKVLKTVDLSVVTITNILSAVLSFVLGIILFNESADILQIIGTILILFGATAINFVNRKGKGSATPLEIFFLVVCALISSTSSIIDKVTTLQLTTQQVQFWFLLFICIFSWIIFAFDSLKNKQFLIKKTDFKNYWIYLVGIFLFIADFFLFLAYKQPSSQMLTITVVSKLKIVVGVFTGFLIFKEKNLLKKILILLIVFAGVILISI